MEQDQAKSRKTIPVATRLDESLNASLRKYCDDQKIDLNAYLRQLIQTDLAKRGLAFPTEDTFSSSPIDIIPRKKSRKKDPVLIAQEELFAWSDTDAECADGDAFPSTQRITNAFRNLERKLEEMRTDPSLCSSEEYMEELRFAVVGVTYIFMKHARWVLHQSDNVRDEMDLLHDDALTHFKSKTDDLVRTVQDLLGFILRATMDSRDKLTETFTRTANDTVQAAQTLKDGVLQVHEALNLHLNSTLEKAQNSMLSHIEDTAKDFEQTYQVMVKVSKKIGKEHYKYKWSVPAVSVVCALAIFVYLHYTKLADRSESIRAEMWAGKAQQLYSYMAEEVYPAIKPNAQEAMTKFCTAIAFPSPAEHLQDVLRAAQKDSRRSHNGHATKPLGAG